MLMGKIPHKCPGCDTDGEAPVLEYSFSVIISGLGSTC